MMREEQHGQGEVQTVPKSSINEERPAWRRSHETESGNSRPRRRRRRQEIGGGLGEGEEVWMWKQDVVDGRGSEVVGGPMRCARGMMMMMTGEEQRKDGIDFLKKDNEYR